MGTSWAQTSCLAVVFSDISQADADLQAQQQAAFCAAAGWTNPVNGFDGPPQAPVPPPQSPMGGFAFPKFRNTPQTGFADCPDGLPFAYTVPAGMFTGNNQLEVDTVALTLANQQAIVHLLCLSDLPDVICLGADFNQSITASSAFLATGAQTNLWEVTSGSLPPGLTFNGGPIGSSATITGTPTTPGDYDFVIGVTLPNGDFNQKEYFVTVAGLTDGGSLPDATIGQAYNATLTSSGFANPQYTISDVPLPDGLSLDLAGNITGTPAADAMGGTFTVFVRDTVTDFTCSQDATINVMPGGINWNDLVWHNPPDNVDPGCSVTNVGATFSAFGIAQNFETGNSGTNTGVFNYTGPLVACNLNLNVTSVVTPDPVGDPLTVHIIVTSDIDGVLLNVFLRSLTGTLIPGVTNHPFNVPLSAGANLSVFMQAGASENNGDGPCSCGFTAVLTPNS